MDEQHAPETIASEDPSPIVEDCPVVFSPAPLVFHTELMGSPDSVARCWRSEDEAEAEVACEDEDSRRLEKSSEGPVDRMPWEGPTNSTAGIASQRARVDHEIPDSEGFRIERRRSGSLFPEDRRVIVSWRHSDRKVAANVFWRYPDRMMGVNAFWRR